VVRALARRRSFQRTLQLLPMDHRDLLQDLLYESSSCHGVNATDAIIESLVRHGRAAQFIRVIVRVLRDLTVDELIIAGDFWDRGPRGDRVVDYLQRQPNVSITWGNHDVAWLGACLGQEALIAHVLRISTRYRQLSQLEEGYGIIMEPLEHLVREVYSDDPADRFVPRGTGLRETVMMARMQKAAAIMQFKLEGQTMQRNPEWNLEHRRMLHRINKSAGTIEIDGVARPLADTRFPTIDPARPYDLSTHERICIDRIRQSFFSSQKLWGHMRWLLERGAMYLIRDNHLIFHGCVPVDPSGDFLALVVDGQPRCGRALFDAIDRVLARVLDKPTDKDKDFLWYLWCGPLSPLFGKDRITTLENDLVIDKATHVETKNPYFQLIHEVEFCNRILSEFGVDRESGLIVNGHVPVKVEKGENPLKRSGKAITIDGAFSVAYGDHGYTLVLESDRTYLAKHHHFESVQQAVQEGVDIIPTIMPVRQWGSARRIGDTERGTQIRYEIELLERLVEAYRTNRIRPN
jgi:fructose-1,6-bisphosphatase-3